MQTSLGVSTHATSDTLTKYNGREITSQIFRQYCLYLQVLIVYQATTFLVQHWLLSLQSQCNHQN